MAQQQSTTATTEPQEIWASEELIATTHAGVEVWRVIHGTESLYDVSNLGNVRAWTVVHLQN